MHVVSISIEDGVGCKSGGRESVHQDVNKSPPPHKYSVKCYEFN